MSELLGSSNLYISAGVYTKLELFVERCVVNSAEVTLVNDGNVVAFVLMAPHERRRHIVIPIHAARDYEVQAQGLIIRYAYLSGCDDILDRGVRFVGQASGLDDVLQQESSSLMLGCWYAGHPGRTTAHFEPVMHWMNDPNGLCRFQGRYHLFYQFNPYGWEWNNMHWGHAVSHDLVHWTHLPVALDPQDSMNFDPTLIGGAFSGSAVSVDDLGVPCDGDKATAIRFFLTRHYMHRDDGDSTVEYQTTCVCHDGIHLSAEETVVVRPDESFALDFRDPKIQPQPNGKRATTSSLMVIATNMATSDIPHAGPGVATVQDGGWFALGALDKPGLHHPNTDRVPVVAAFLADRLSLDGARWRYAGPLLADIGHGDAGTFECPDMFSLDGEQVVIAALTQYRDIGGRFQPVRWYSGTIEHEGDAPRLNVHTSGWYDFGSCCYAIQSFEDQCGRRIAFGWFADWFGIRPERESTSNGAMSLPRELHMRDGQLYSRPVVEVYQNLLGDVIGVSGKVVEASASTVWYAVPGNAYYADITFTEDMEFDFTLAATGPSSGHLNGTSLHLISHDGVTRLVTKGLSTDTLRCDANVVSVRRIEIFFDRCVAEVFLNDGEAAGTMLFDDPSENGEFRGVFYPSKANDCGIDIQLRQLNGIW